MLEELLRSLQDTIFEQPFFHDGNPQKYVGHPMPRVEREREKQRKMGAGGGGWAWHSEVTVAVAVGFSRGGGHNHRQGGTFTRAEP